MSTCLHCENILDENQKTFCCSGCKYAYKIICKNGFENFYKSRIFNPKESKLKPEIEINFNPDEFISFNEKTQIYQIDLAIHGLHCGACIWLIENLLKKQNYIIQSRVNLTNKTIKICWRGENHHAYEIIKLINSIGYKLLPLDIDKIHESEQKFDNRIFKALAVAGFGVGNIMLFSFGLWFDKEFEIIGATRKFLHLLSALIALPVLIYSGRIFVISAFKSIKSKMPNMDIAISIAIILTSITSLMQTFRGGQQIYFDSALMLVFFLLIGKYLDLKARKKAFDIAAKFSFLQTSFARVLYDDTSKLVPVKKLQVNDILLITSGEKISCDGIVVGGDSYIDNSLITGESMPEKISLNSRVFGGSINIDAPIRVKITKTYNDSLLSQIVSCINNIQLNKNIYIRIADQFSKYYTPVVHILALLTFLVWYFVFKLKWDMALMHATAVLIITCPCALALAIPIVQTITIGNFLKKGIILKNGEALEKINKIDCLVFDKTGTLTQGKPQLKTILKITNNKISELNPDEYIFFKKISSTLARYSKHPLSQELTNLTNESFNHSNVVEHKGQGIEGIVNNKITKLGNSEFCDIGIDFNQKLIDELMIKFHANLRCFMKHENSQIIFLFGDDLKEDAEGMINYFNKIGKKIILLSGDYESEVVRVAKKLNFKNYYWQKTPLQKVEILEQLTKKKITFMMIGDGLNDAPSLALSNISVSFSKAVDISQNIADIVVNSSQLNPLIFIFEYSKKSLKTMKQNLSLGLIYNLIAVPFAVMGYVNPLVAAISMCLSSLLVTLNSFKMNSIQNVEK